MTGQVARQTLDRVGAYSDTLEHLSQELDRLDILIARRVARLRRQWSVAEAAQGAQSHLFVSNDEVDGLLGRSDGGPAGRPDDPSADGRLAEIDGRLAAAAEMSLAAGVDLPLERIAGLFKLTAIERQALVICLAPELRAKYDRLYAYLQNDITRKKPTVELVLDLCCENERERWRFRPLFEESGVLLRTRLLQSSDDPQSPSGSSGLAHCLRLDPGILAVLLGQYMPDKRLRGMTRLHDGRMSVPADLVDPAARDSLLQASKRHFADAATVDRPLFLHLHGPRGVGRRDLALADCQRLGCPMLEVDLERLLSDGVQVEDLLTLAFRDSLLLQAPVFFSGFDGLADPANRMVARILAKVVEEFGWLSYAAGDKPLRLPDLQRAAVCHSIALPPPDVDRRREAWQRALQVHWPKIADVPIEPLAHGFRLTQGQILDAVQLARRRSDLSDGDDAPTTRDLAAAAREQSNQRLGSLAVKVTPRYGWDDIVLPPGTADTLREISAQARHRYRVMTEWGFGTKLAHGTGLGVLFSGPPGTGKTMAAQVIASELQVDLYKVDLARVVSKYIGETEKNLGRIFDEAETSNAVLFFDEADALFGKRTDVSDAHDRYANIEVSYLLQKMEESSGIVILASNFRNNMDEAFIRRIRFILDFPFPDEAGRRAIWKVHFPQQAPVSEQIDYDFLAREVPVAGGSIKNIVLNAAFRAADSGCEIGMPHIIQSTKSEFAKIGKLWHERTFAGHAIGTSQEGAQ